MTLQCPGAAAAAAAAAITRIKFRKEKNKKFSHPIRVDSWCSESWYSPNLINIPHIDDDSANNNDNDDNDDNDNNDNSNVDGTDNNVNNTDGNSKAANKNPSNYGEGLRNY